MGIIFLFLGAGTVSGANINGKIPDKSNILNDENVNNKEINTNILNKYPTGIFMSYFFICNINITTYNATRVMCFPLTGNVNYSLLYTVAILCEGGKDEVVANYSIKPLLGLKKDVSIYTVFTCMIVLFKGKFDFDIPYDENGGHMEGLAILMAMYK